MKVLVAYYVVATSFVYIAIPIGDIYFGLLSLCFHESYKVKETGYEEIFADWHSTFPALKIFEQLREAVPQVSA